MSESQQRRAMLERTKQSLRETQRIEQALRRYYGVDR